MSHHCKNGTRRRAWGPSPSAKALFKTALMIELEIARLLNLGIARIRDVQSLGGCPLSISLPDP